MHQQNILGGLYEKINSNINSTRQFEKDLDLTILEFNNPINPDFLTVLVIDQAMQFKLKFLGQPTFYKDHHPLYKMI